MLGLWVLPNSMTRLAAPFLSKRIVSEGCGGTKKAIFICIVKCENKIVNSFSWKKKRERSCFSAPLFKRNDSQIKNSKVGALRRKS